MPHRALLIPCLLLVGTPAVASSRGAPMAAASPAGQPIPWQWSPAPDLYPGVALVGRIRHSAYVLREIPVGRGVHATGSTWAELRRELRKGGITRVVWRTPIRMARSLPGAAFVVSGNQVFVARYHRIATTCALSAFSASTGKLLWHVTLRGYGPVAHSKWFNRVQLRVVGGHPVVYGHEGPGTSYVEARDAATGALRAYRRFAMRLPPAPLAEALHAEIHRVLKGQPRYHRTVADFIRGHVLRLPSPGVALTRFREAVRQLDGLPFSPQGGTLRVSLRRLPSGSYAIEAQRR